MSETFDVCVTGAGGYIGSRVVVELLESGHDVTAIDSFRSAQVEEIDGVRVEDGDVRDRGDVREAVEGSDIVTHLAAMSDVQECEEKQEEAFDINVGGTENVAWVCRESETPLVFPCSMAVVGDPVEIPITSNHPRRPLNHYGRTKVMSEEDIGWLAEDSFPAHIYIKSNLYGHHEIDGESVGKRTVINIFIEKALEQGPLTVHEPGTQARDFLHVKDAARAYLCSLENLLNADDGALPLPIASGDCMSVLELAETVRDIVEEERGYAVDIDIVENPRDSGTVSDDIIVDTDEARDVIGFETEYTVEDAIREMVE